MKKILFPLCAMAIACSLIVVSCSKSNEEDMTDPGAGGGGGGTPTCDTTNRTYTAHVVPILQSNCYGCHANGASSGGVSLGTYAALKTQADNGRLMGSITHASGFAAMPLGRAKLSDCDINIIRAWIARGAQNN
jgi:uncharacterized membrane protein